MVTDGPQRSKIVSSSSLVFDIGQASHLGNYAPGHLCLGPGSGMRIVQSQMDASPQNNELWSMYPSSEVLVRLWPMGRGRADAQYAHDGLCAHPLVAQFGALPRHSLKGSYNPTIKLHHRPKAPTMCRASTYYLSQATNAAHEGDGIENERSNGFHVDRTRVRVRAACGGGRASGLVAAVG